MKKLVFLVLFFSASSYGQVGINTTTPKGALDIVSNNLGLVLPRVTQIEDVTNNNSGLAENGTIVYDESRNQTCFRISSTWICIANDASIAVTTPALGTPPLKAPIVKKDHYNTLKKQDR
ncbi:hypothetical protein ATE92_0691 [Ulvibacter sp. MAR_2010_11]|uniref:hypothetical protein n=1 Tax=Ulvibacter sp. MAR_2010_11 TaxID=1250229 RepID=UPI000C2C0453|nr:hypothetical protein [Ulvibacter sp. MAR_2010_11]PKA82560.1 hypothetical protein ATE92_0691 [Ulvibacter sp. MAR_2010_11]